MQLRADINNFDLANYVETTTASRSNGAHYNPCPICMHDDCLEITGALYRCYSDNHPKTAGGKIGGSIIDYLMQADNLTHGQALDKYKFDYTKGYTWTTDAIYRETPEKIKYFKEKGVVCVEMEGTVIAAVCKRLNVSGISCFC